MVLLLVSAREVRRSLTAETDEHASKLPAAGRTESPAVSDDAAPSLLAAETFDASEAAGRHM